jgi:FkbM family methyltransferase
MHPTSAELLEQTAALLGATGKSTSQLGQDIIALLHSGGKRAGYFVEFGATDGVSLSNTFMLESHFGWTGILAEPAPSWHAALRANRTAAIDTDCVWHTTGEHLDFAVADDRTLSSLMAFRDRDQHQPLRANAATTTVRTVSLNDLLDRYDAPQYIDFLSVDTEGSECDILQAVDFTRYRFGLIACEHNYTAARQQIHTLLRTHGYRRKLVGLSQWDDWYFLDESRR